MKHYIAKMSNDGEFIETIPIRDKDAKTGEILTGKDRHFTRDHQAAMIVCGSLNEQSNLRKQDHFYEVISESEPGDLK